MLIKYLTVIVLAQLLSINLINGKYIKNLILEFLKELKKSRRDLFLIY
jgi:hypothetical protein